MKSRLASLLWLAVLALAIAVSVDAALAAGGIAYTKRLKTVLLAEPSPLAAPAGELAFARPLAINEVRGNWLRVSAGPATGWVFTGNVSATAPVESKGLDGLPLAASQTTATAAARPLTEVSAEYANRHDLAKARPDLEWLLEQSSRVTALDVEAFLQLQKRGEFQ